MTKNTQKVKELEPGTTKFFLNEDSKKIEYMVTKLEVKIGGQMSKVKVLAQIVNLDIYKKEIIPVDDILFAYETGALVFTS